MEIKATGVFVLADDVQVTAIEEGDFVVTRATGRRYSKVIDGETAALVREFTHGATIVDAILQYCHARDRDPEETLDAAFPVLEELILAHVLAVADSDESAPVVQSLGRGDAPPYHMTKHAAANRFSPGERLLAHYARRLDPAGALFEAGLPEPPRSSINYGSGGVAYFFYRLACIGADARLLSWAKLWIEKAIRESETKEEFAFRDADGEITPEVVGPVALYHSPTGLHAVKAVIGHAAHDQAAQMEGLAGFVKAAQPPCDNIDVTVGTSGVLLGAALLDEAMPGQPEVRSLGARLLAAIWAQLDAMPEIAEARSFGLTGIAHGWAGVLYAVLSWCRITGAPLPATLPARLHQLAGLAEPSGDGVRWSQHVRSASDRDPPVFSAGWCNGTAGMIHLWTRAHEMLDDTRFLKLAEGAARDVTATLEPAAQLCCGRPGQAYALLALYKHTGDRRWLNHAREFAQQSLQLSPLPADTEAPPLHYALYKGALGTALLSADLDEPSQACMPLFESEGWKPDTPSLAAADK
jgi:eukaryotic-like serine/threonine-protein kinase